jgi:hypothetical protein
MTSPTTKNRLTSRRRLRRRTRVAWLDPMVDARARSVRALTYEWSIAQGQPVRRSTLDVIIGTRAELGFGLACWRSDEVSSMLWVDVIEFCTHLDIEVPRDLADALWAMLMALESTDQLEHPEPFETLIEPLVSTGGLDDAERHRILGLSSAG